MGKFPGQVNADIYGVVLPELKPVLLSYTAAEAEAADDDGLFTAQETHTENALSATTFLAQPKLARGLILTPSAAADAGNIVVEGTGIDGNILLETIATNGATAVLSIGAFRTVTKVTVPKDDAGITWKAGWDDRIGLPFKLEEKPFGFEIFNDALELTTAGAFAVDGDALSKNTYNPNGAIDGLKTLKLLLFV